MSDDTPAVGGSGKSGPALKAELAPPRRSEAENAKRLLDGTAWREFCRALEAAGGCPLVIGAGSG